MEANLERSPIASARLTRHARATNPSRISRPVSGDDSRCISHDVSRGDSRNVSPRPPTSAPALLLFAWLSIFIAGSATAQDWGSEDDGWSQPAIRNEAPQPGAGWALKMGLGFTDDPDTLLLYFEAPYAFDQWVSLGPAIQIGIDDRNTIVAPTVNLTVTVPIFERVRPYISTGIGFAYLAEDGRPGGNDDAGFLINFGVGLEYQLSDRLAVGSQMIFNFLPNETLGEDFFYSWQVGGVRISF